jgi:DNA-binding XRE family transcriptional regulator
MTRKHLRQAREKAGLSQEDLAHEVGTTQQTYRSAELGERSIKLDLALSIAERLGYDCSPLRRLFAVVDR